MAGLELQQPGQRGIPVILENGHIVVGFDRAQLECLLAQTRASPLATGREVVKKFRAKLWGGGRAALCRQVGRPHRRHVHGTDPEHVRRRSRMYEPLIQRVRQDVVLILQSGAAHGAVRRAVQIQVMGALGEMEVTAVRVQQIAYAAMCGSIQAAEQTGQPIEIVGEEASAGVLEAVKQTGGKATQFVQEAIQGAVAAVEEAVAKLKEKASEVAKKSRKALQSLIDRLKSSPQGVGGSER